MPRLKRNDCQERDAIRREIVKGRIAYSGKTQNQFFMDLGMTAATGCRKLKDPGKFTADEIRRMKLSQEDNARFISGK